jgi:hypothetical protein
MVGRRMPLVAAGALLLMGGTGLTQAASGNVTYRSLHLNRGLRVDGKSDLRNHVWARSGLKVTAGLTSDTLKVSGPARLGGILDVAGMLTAGGVTTAGSIQAAGGLNVAGDIVLGGNVNVGKTLTAAGENLNGGSLQAGAITAGSLNASGQVTGNSFSTNGSVSAGVGHFASLAVTPGGSVNFNNASISGLNLNGTATLSSLQLSNTAAGGTNGFQILSIAQAGKTASLSVGSAGVLRVAGTGLGANSLSISGDASVGGTLTAGTITSTSTLTLSAPNVLATGNLSVGPNGDLQLNNTATGAASHILGNRDTRGTCTAGATMTPVVNTCTVSFINAYPSAPVAVVTPTNIDPGMVTGYTVATSSSSLTIRFTTATSTTVTFNYVVEG